MGNARKPDNSASICITCARARRRLLAERFALEPQGSPAAPDHPAEQRWLASCIGLALERLPEPSPAALPAVLSPELDSYRAAHRSPFLKPFASAPTASYRQREATALLEGLSQIGASAAK